MDFKSRNDLKLPEQSLLSSEDYHSSLIISKGPQYSGLLTYSCKFTSLPLHPIYHFPVLSSAQTEASRQVLNRTDFTSSQMLDLKTALAILHQRSPFRRGEQALHFQVEQSSQQTEEPQGIIFNLADQLAKDSLSSDQSFQQRSNPIQLSQDARDLIRQLHSNCIQKKQACLVTPASSEHSPESIQQRLTYDQSMQFDDFMNSFNQDFDSQIDWDQQLRVTSNDSIPSQDQIYITASKTIETANDPLVQLIPQTDTDNSFQLFCSVEALQKARLTLIDEDMQVPEQQGSIRVSITNRMFLQGPASKAKLTQRDQSISCQPPDMTSPLIRKLVVCQQVSPESHQVEIIYSLGACGFQASPSLEYDSAELKSKGFISDNPCHPLFGLVSQQILKEFTTTNIAWISSGFQHCAVVTVQGKVMTWGYGASGCLGHGNTSTYTQPEFVNSLFQQTILYLQCGGYHTAAVSDQGLLFTWGRGDVHQLGIPNSKLCKDDMGYVALRPIKLQSLSNIKSVACGEAHTLVIDQEGQVFCFGWGQEGQLGVPPYQLNQQQNTNSILKLDFPYRVVKVSAGCVFSSCLTEEGCVFVWGNGEQGQLGLGPRMKRSEFPTAVAQLKTEKVVDIVCGESHMIAYCQSGKVFGWGQGIVGHFKDEKNFPKGSGVVCYLPRELCSIDIVQRFIVN